MTDYYTYYDDEEFFHSLDKKPTKSSIDQVHKTHDEEMEYREKNFKS